MGRGSRTPAAQAAFDIRDALRPHQPAAGAQPSWLTSTRMPPLVALQWTQLASSNVLQVAFTRGPESQLPPRPGDAGSLFVEFKSSSKDGDRVVYRLDDVPHDEWQAFVASASPGRHFKAFLHDRYDGDKLTGEQIPD